jgi:hypothetical protein
MSDELREAGHGADDLADRVLARFLTPWTCPIDRPAAIIFVPAPMMPPSANMPPPLASTPSCASMSSSAPGRRSSSACTLSAGPSLRRNSNMMPTAFSAASRSIPTFATSREMSSSMVPSLPHWRQVGVILNAIVHDDKRAATRVCNRASSLTRR